MLQSIRDKTRGWLAYVVVGLISVPFLLWGVQEYLGGGGQLAVATVNGVEITSQELKRATQLHQQRLRSMFGGDVPAALLEGEAVQQTVLSGLVKQELLRQFADDSGLRASDAQVRATVEEEPAFQVDGKFSNERFVQLLEMQRMKTGRYEHSVRVDLQNSQFQQALSDSGFTTDSAKKQYLSLLKQQRDISYLRLPQSQFISDISITDDEIKTYFDKNAQRYLTEERVKLQYVELDVQKLEENIDVSEEALRDLYEQEIDLYATPESRKAAHILVKLAPGSSDAQKAEAEAKADALIALMNKGSSFSELAMENSEDKLSAKNGGELGFILPGDMDPDFEKGLFELNAGQVSKPIQSAQGFHLIQLLEIKEKQQQSFDDAKAKVEKEYRSREANRVLVDKSEQLLTLSYESPDSLEPTADALGAKLQLTDWVTRSFGGGIAREAKIRTAAFLPTVINGNNSEVVELADGRQIVVRVAEHEQAQPKPLTEVKEAITAQLKADRARVLAEKMGEEKLAELRTGTSLASIAGQQGLDVSSPGLIERKNNDFPQEILKALFIMEAPKESVPTVDGQVLANGDYALLQVNSVIKPEIELSDQNALSASAVVANNNQREFEAAYRAMESRAKLSVSRQDVQQQ